MGQDTLGPSCELSPRSVQGNGLEARLIRILSWGESCQTHTFAELWSSCIHGEGDLSCGFSEGLLGGYSH